MRLLCLALLTLVTPRWRQQGWTRAETDCVFNDGVMGLLGDCTGDYCFNLKNYRNYAQLKGCVSGTALNKNMSNECVEDKNGAKQCWCSGVIQCNYQIDRYMNVNAKNISCYCDEGEDCVQGQCFGESCVLVKRPGRPSSRRCLSGTDDGIPLWKYRSRDQCSSFSRKLQKLTKASSASASASSGSASSGSASSSSSSSGASPPRHSQGAEVECTCHTPLCNTDEYFDGFDLNAGRRTCALLADIRHDYGQGDPSPRACRGQHCYELEVDVVDSRYTLYRGCVWFKVDAPAAVADKGNDWLSGTGCLQLNSQVLNIKYCLDVDNQDADQQPLPASLVDHRDAYTQTGTGDDGDNNGGGDPSSSTPRTRHRNSNATASEQGVVGSTPKRTATPRPTRSRLAASTSTSAPDTGGGNTTTIIVFVVIIVLIVVAGLVWKFELYKKLFHARYQTVAG